MEVDPSLPLGDPGPSTLANRLRRLATLPDEPEANPLVGETLRTLRSKTAARSLEVEEDEDPDEASAEDFAEPDHDNNSPDAFGLEEDEIEEYKLTAWDSIDIAIEQEARGA
jgi:hypothetical protein